MYYLNPSIKDLHRVFDQNERNGYIRLDLNENPGGLPQNLVKSVLSDITPQFISQYPETLHFTQILANYLNTDISHLCLVNGSAEGIRYIIEAFTSPKGKILGVVPSYFMFQIYSLMYDRDFIPIHYKNDLSMDINDIVDKMKSDVQLLVLLNPNNPMGNTYTDEEMQILYKKAKENEITLLIDEAYYYFYPKTFIKYALENEHIFITRTFSKLFSMACCRLGYVVGGVESIKYIQKLCTPHNTNGFALKIAEEILTSPNIIKNLIRKYKIGRNYIIENLDHHNYVHYGDAGNFIFIKPKTNAQKIVYEMKEKKKILIKYYSNIGNLGDCLRVSLGEKKYMKLFLDALYEIDK